MTLIVTRDFGVEVYTEETDEHFCCVIQPDFSCDTRLEMTYEEYVQKCPEDSRLYCTPTTYNNTTQYGHPMFVCLGLMMYSTTPSSGSPISIAGLAKEKAYDSYWSSSTPSTPYSLTDLTVGGNSNGNGFSAESTNTSGSPYPNPNTSTPHSMSEWYDYDHVYVVPNVTAGLSVSDGGNADNYLWTGLPITASFSGGGSWGCLCVNGCSHSAICVKHTSYGFMPPWKHNFSSGAAYTWNFTSFQVNWNNVGSSNQGQTAYRVAWKMTHGANVNPTALYRTSYPTSGY